MKISIQELRKIISEAVKAQLSEENLQEGPKEIQIRQTMLELKEVIVGSIVEDLVRETGMEEMAVERVVGSAFDKMVSMIVRELDIPNVMGSAEAPRRRIVSTGGLV